MGHIAAGGGRFVTVMPRSRDEDRWFRDWIQTTPRPGPRPPDGPATRLGEPDEVYSTFPAPLPSAEGYRIVWVHSTAKAARDAAARTARIEAGIAALDALAARLAGPEVPAQDPRRRRAGRRRGAGRRRRRPLGQRHRHRDHRRRPTSKNAAAGPAPTPATGAPPAPATPSAPTSRLDRIAYDAASDGCFPLITNDHDLTDARGARRLPLPAQPRTPPPPAQVRPRRRPGPAAQPRPDRSPVLLPVPRPAPRRPHRTPDPHRHGRRAHAADIPLYPELRDCPAPSTERILEIFADLTRHELHHDGHLVQTFEPELTPLQQQVLDLLGLPPHAYTQQT